MNSSAQPQESLRAKEYYTQIAVSQGGLIFINVAKGDAITWCPSISLSGTQYLSEPLGLVQRGSTTTHPNLQVRTRRA